MDICTCTIHMSWEFINILPNKCVHMLPVSVCILNIDLKHSLNEFVGIQCPLCKKLLSCSQSGRWWWWTTLHPASHTRFTNSSACSAALHGPGRKSKREVFFSISFSLSSQSDPIDTVFYIMEKTRYRYILHIGQDILTYW